MTGAPPTAIFYIQTFASNGIDDRLHVDHRRGQKRTHPDNFRIVLGCGADKFVRTRIRTQVNDGETGSFCHHSDEVFADIVKITFDGSHDNRPHAAGVLAFGKQRAQHLHTRFHSPGGQKHFRHKDTVVLEIFADHTHSCDQAVVEHFIDGTAGRRTPPQS